MDDDPADEQYKFQNHVEGESNARFPQTKPEDV
jgi:hypothetical protein